MTNMKLLIIGGVLVFLLVVFGRNPVEERRKEKAESMKGKDMLVESIKEHNSKRRMPRSGSNSGGLMGNRSSPYSTGGAPARSSTKYPSYMIKSGPATSTPYGQNPFAKQSAPAAAPQTSAPQTNNYYPPPPLPEKDNKQRYTPQYVPGPGSNLGVKLRSGQPVFFSGQEVFTVDANGKAVPLPDGKYPMADGRIIMRVKNGRKIVVND